MSAVLTILILLGAAAGILATLNALRQERERQNRLIVRMRRDAERQERAMSRLYDRVNASTHRVDRLSQDMETRQERLRRTLDDRVSQMQRSNDQSLERVRQAVTDKLDTRLNESFKLVNAQLADVNRGLGEMREAAAGLGDFKRLLGGVKTRGIWGEVQLGALMKEMFAPQQYLENAAIPEGSAQRVEYALKLPTAEGDERLLPIDAKFPREDYLRLIAAQESGDREGAKQCAAQLDRAVMEQARRIGEKYIHPPMTTDFAVLFLPTESLYAETARLDGLLERTQTRYRVLIAGPTTLSALLNSLQMGMKSLSLQRQSAQVLRQLSDMREDFDQFDDSVRRMRLRLDQAGRELDALESRARRAVRAIDLVGEDVAKSPDDR